jgi:hypothetical protein
MKQYANSDSTDDTLNKCEFFVCSDNSLIKFNTISTVIS